MKTFKIMSVSALVVVAFCFGKTFSSFEKNLVEFPELNAAKKNLMESKNHLDKAAKDFKGHRAKAIEYTDKAIKEVDQAILAGDAEK